MWWFRKDKPREIWDEEIKWPIGDIEAADRIRNICRAAADSAVAVARFAVGMDDKTKRAEIKRKSETERYERAVRAAMEITLKFSDDLMRDAAVGQIVDLCLKANDLKTARILFRAIQADSIREDVLSQHPLLRQ